MDTTVMTIRTDERLKNKAMQIAHNLGFSLSSLVNAYLRHFVRTKTVSFSAEEGEEPSDFLMKLIKKAEENRKAGRYVSFDDPEKALAFLDRIIAKKHRAH